MTAIPTSPTSTILLPNAGYNHDTLSPRLYKVYEPELQEIMANGGIKTYGHVKVAQLAAPNQHYTPPNEFMVTILDYDPTFAYANIYKIMGEPPHAKTGQLVNDTMMTDIALNELAEHYQVIATNNNPDLSKKFKDQAAEAIKHIQDREIITMQQLIDDYLKITEIVKELIDASTIVSDCLSD